jgi:hypothetical protein
MQRTTAFEDRQQCFGANPRAANLGKQNSLDPATVPFAPEKGTQQPARHGPPAKTATHPRTVRSVPNTSKHPNQTPKPPRRPARHPTAAKA